MPGFRAHRFNHIIEGEPQPIAEINPRVPQGLESIVRRCMMKAPQERYASTRDLRAICVNWIFRGGGGLWIWLRRPYRPEPDAVVWFQKGLSALHSMTFDAARKALEQAVAADHKFALAHASLAIAFGADEAALKSFSEAEIAYADGHFEEAKARARMAISALPSAGDQAEVGAKVIEALASIRNGGRSEGIQSALNLVQDLDKSKLIVAAASARLSFAEALAAAKESRLAKNLLPAALAFFEQRRIWESAWRGHMVSAQIAENFAEAEAHRASALSILAQLRKTWSGKDVERYLERADIKALCGAMQLR